MTRTTAAAALAALLASCGGPVRPPAGPDPHVAPSVPWADPITYYLPTAPPVASTACASGRGWPVPDSDRIVPCTWSAGQVLAAQCGTGWKVCTTNPLHADPLWCAGSLPWGFFAAASPAWSVGDPARTPAACEWTTSQSGGTRVIMGCGTTGGTVQGAPTKCSGWQVLAACEGPGAAYSCSRTNDPAADLAGTRAAGAKGGVLCCAVSP